MENGFKALHRAVNRLLRARRAINHAAAECRRDNSQSWFTKWEGSKLQSQLDYDLKVAQEKYAQAEEALCETWEALRYPLPPKRAKLIYTGTQRPYHL